MFDSLQILRHYFETKRSPGWRCRAELEEWQAAKFEKFAKTTLVQSAFYKSYAVTGAPLSAYPTSNKMMMLENFDTTNTRGLSRHSLFELAQQAEKSRDFSSLLGDISVGLSSGTSGTRGLFVASKSERLRYAGVVLAKCLPAGIFSPQRVALLLRANNQLYETVGGGGRISFKYFDLLGNWADVLKNLDLYQPTILVGPPQVLCLVADAQLRKEIDLSPLKVIAGAEVLDHPERQVLESAFRVPVDQIYQATEGFLGITCNQGTLHLNEDFLIFERHWVDPTSRRFMPVITDFTRSTQPIIRYRLDDILIERSEPCPCGSLMRGIERIEGRADDVLFLPRTDDALLMPLMPDFVRDVLAPKYDIVGDYVMAQVSPEEIEFSFNSCDRSSAKDMVREALQSLFDRMCLRMPTLVFKDRAAADPRQKLRRVRRMFPVPEGAAWTAY